jgi:rhomboid family GlyGly-CTERM serine protease
MTTRLQNIVKQIPWATLFLTALALLVHLFHPLRPHLLYTKTDLMNGDLWRLLACHWVHLNTDHLLWSALTFLLLGSICEIMDRKRYAVTIGTAAMLIPAAIWVGMPHLQVYGGLSGLDCALYSLLIVMFIKREKPPSHRIWIAFYILMLILLPAKVIYEMASGLTIFVNNFHTDMAPVPLSHLIGGVVGFMVGFTATCRTNSPVFPALDLHISGPACKACKQRTRTQGADVGVTP